MHSRAVQTKFDVGDAVLYRHSYHTGGYEKAGEVVAVSVEWDSRNLCRVKYYVLCYDTMVVHSKVVEKQMRLDPKRS